MTITVEQAFNRLSDWAAQGFHRRWSVEFTDTGGCIARASELSMSGHVKSEWIASGGTPEELVVELCEEMELDVDQVDPDENNPAWPEAAPNGHARKATA